MSVSNLSFFGEGPGEELSRSCSSPRLGNLPGRFTGVTGGASDPLSCSSCFHLIGLWVAELLTGDLIGDERVILRGFGTTADVKSSLRVGSSVVCIWVTTFLRRLVDPVESESSGSIVRDVAGLGDVRGFLGDEEDVASSNSTSEVSCARRGDFLLARAGLRVGVSASSTDRVLPLPFSAVESTSPKTTEDLVAF